MLKGLVGEQSQLWSAASQQPLRMLATTEWDLLLDFIDPVSKDRIDLCDRDSPSSKA